MIRTALREPALTFGISPTPISMRDIALNRPFLVSLGNTVQEDNSNVNVCLPCYSPHSGGSRESSMVPMFPVVTPVVGNNEVGYEFVNVLEARYRFLRYLRQDEFVGFSGLP